VSHTELSLSQVQTQTNRGTKTFSSAQNNNHIVKGRKLRMNCRKGRRRSSSKRRRKRKRHTRKKAMEKKTKRRTTRWPLRSSLERIDAKRPSM